jgi:NAD(P)H dehydrogenase (quinone)
MTSSDAPLSGFPRVLVVLGGARNRGLGKRLMELSVTVLREAGAEVRVHDLLADGFDPVLRLEEDERHATRCTLEEDPLVARYQDDAIWAEAFIVLHPVWWFAPPAIIKGWVDRVFVHEVALRQRAGASPAPLFEGKRALVVQTFNTNRAVDRALFLGMTSFFWKRAVFFSVGISKVARLALYEVEKLDGAKLARFEQRLVRAVHALTT